MTDLRDQALGYLQYAIEAYGADLMVAVREPEPEPGAGAGPGAGAEAKTRVEGRGGAAGGEGDGEEMESEREPGMAAAGLEELAAEAAGCRRCKLAGGRTQVVFGEGSPAARVMFVGEAPGYHEDAQGRPFVGRAGQLLDRIITGAMGMRRKDVFIANVNKCRPPGNRDPEPDEVAACLPFLRQQIALIRPEVIVTLGRVAAWNLLGETRPMRRLRGRELTYEGIPVVPTWHPAYLLRQPAAKAETWEDIKRVNRLLGRPEVPPAAT